MIPARYPLSAIVISATAALLYLSFRPPAKYTASSNPRPTPASLPTSTSRPTPPPQLNPARPALATYSILATPTPEGHSPLADHLHDPATTGQDDVAIVFNLCTHYHQAFHGFPVGEDNATITRALTGQNPQHLAFLPRDHPALDSTGQLLDRYGHPYFFHLQGRDSMQVRSAGPDGHLYTPDDQITGSVEPSPPPSD